MEKLLLALARLLEAVTKALGPRAPRWLTRLNGPKAGPHAATVAVTAPDAQAASYGNVDRADHLGGVHLKAGAAGPAIRAPMEVPPADPGPTVSSKAIPEPEAANTGSYPIDAAISGQPLDSTPVAVAEASMDPMPTGTSAVRVERDILPADIGELLQVAVEEIPGIPEAADPAPAIADRELANGEPSAPSVSDQSPESPTEAATATSLAPMLTSAGMVRTEPDLLPADTGDLSQKIDGSDPAAGVADEAAAPLGHDVAVPAEAADDAGVLPDDTTLTAADYAPDLPEASLAEERAGSSHQEAPDGVLEAGVDATGGSAPSAVDERQTETTDIAGQEPPSLGTTEPLPEVPAPFGPRSRQPAVHRDRRGKRRTVAASDPPAQPSVGAPEPAARPPAEAKLRLSLQPIRRTARLSVVLTRPDGFPARVTVQVAGSPAVEAYDERRYDDLDLPWTSELLDGELRLASAERLQWLRSARQVHVFAADPNEPDLISVSAVSAGVAHTLLCRSTDAEAVRVAAESTGSTAPQLLDHWQGIPEGWIVLTGYTPMRSAAPPLPAGLRPLDPGEGLEIIFDGGLAIRQRVYAAGHPPRISITPAPGGASVTIGGQPATISSDGTWVAPGWDTPGQHMVDVVPGPSVSYEIAADPWLHGGWDFWDAYPTRFGENAKSPWARARICGALILGPAGETVIAHEARPTLVALGARSGATPLRQRDDLAVSVGLTAEPPAFLLSATGPRRTQGRVVWLGPVPAQNASKRHDAEWVATVRNATARRLPLVEADALGEDAWRKAKARARQLRNRRPRT